MKKNVLIGVIVAVVLIAGGVGIWYFSKSKDGAVVVPKSNSNDLVKPKSNDSTNGSATINSIPIDDMNFSETYDKITKEQRDCLLNAIGKEKLDAFMKNDVAGMQKITQDEYEKALACQK
jgi:hypothetical protein